MEALLKGSAGLEAKRVLELHGEDAPSDYKVGSGISSSSSEEHGSKSSSPEHQDSVISNSKQTSPVRLTEISSMNASSRSPQLELSHSKLDQLKSAKAEMGEMKEENERLKMILSRIVKDYQSLQMQFCDAVQQEQTKNSTESASINSDQEMEEEPELVSLRLGTAPISKPKKEDQVELSSKKDKDEKKQRAEGLTLGLDCKFDDTKDADGQKDAAAKSETTENSFGEAANAGGEQLWPPSKALKTQRSGDVDELSQQAQVKKARVSVRARCDAPTMNDGCQWRKYGQKIAKGNPCPRAYYRCTVAPGCPVRKQVQRCADDMTILITTYEGTHNHPLPISATAMASTTSAAACMLMSGSSTSVRQVLGASSSTATTSADLHGLNFGLSDIHNSGSSRPFYLSNHSISSPSYPTITLDLTAPPSTTNSQFTRFSSSLIPSFSKPSSTSFNFTTAESSSGLSTPWTSTGNNYISYNNTSQSPYSKPQFGSFNLAATQSAQDHMYQPYMQKNAANDPTQAAGLSETIAAATKVLTSDPNFRSALAAAITSIVSNGNGGSSANGRGDAQMMMGHSMKWGEQFHNSLAPFTAAATAAASNSCAPIFRSPSNAPSSNQTGNLMFLPSNSSPFSSAKSSTPSPVENRGHPS